MAETLHEMAVRMVGDRCTLGCAGCPAKALWDKNDICLIRLVLKAENCEEQIDGMKAWAAEHPAPMYPSWREAWQSLFPDIDHLCPEDWFGEDCPKDMECRGCLARPMSKKVAEKLGIKPITMAKVVPAHDGCEGCRWMDKHEDEEPCKIAVAQWVDLRLICGRRDERGKEENESRVDFWRSFVFYSGLSREGR